MSNSHHSVRSEEPGWVEVVEISPIPTILVAGARDRDDPGHITATNAAARALLDPRGSENLIDRSLVEFLGPETQDAFIESLRVSRRSASPGEAGPSPLTTTVGTREPETFTVHLQPRPSGDVIVQLVARPAHRAVDRLLAEQKRFRVAVMEISELAHTTKDDDEFYQRLIERAVEVVPGAQGGSVQLKIDATTTFRFVAAVGYDLAQLQKMALDQEHFFRDAWNPTAQIIHNFDAVGRTPEVTEWLQTAGRLGEIAVNVSAPVLSDGFPVAFLSLDNFVDPDAMTETSIEMTTVLGSFIGELLRRRGLEAEVLREREAFRHLALHDPLTGLANRRRIEQLLAEGLTDNTCSGSSAAILFVDLDDFKDVNDRLGHAVGDRLLVRVGQGLRAAARADDIVGRWGGDEFLVLPRGVSSKAEAVELADRIMAWFTAELDLGDGLRHRASLTIGVGWSPTSSGDTDRLFRAADDALYAAKSSGKGIVEIRTA